MGNWLLPESLADVLPAEARRIEELRRELLDLYRTYGFELVAPPLVEYIDSLLSGTGSDLDLRTCKLIDQLSGRTLGVRADMTPQVTRIDAHLLNRAGVTRLCYCGNVLHARPSDLLSSRELLQIGAEIYGHAGFEADLEIIQLVLETVAIAGVRNPRLDLNHPGVLRAILKSDPAAAELAQDAIRLMRDKDVPGLGELAARAPGIRPETLKALQLLPTLYGGQDVLKIARRDLPALPGIAEALDALQAVVDAMPNVSFSVDLADVGGYAYHSGVKFALYAEGWHDALVSGGRYDDVSHAFGRSRPATGFSLDLRKLAAGLPPAERARAVRAPWGQAPALTEAVRRLRRSGEIVVQVLPGHEQDQDEFVCDRELALQDGVWTVKTL
ncbi:ATP phosphoribosyltransferase regulatory subunit [Achromobacter xylosoxidans]|jgi:ATP phosphoribosyltransferase regulatory subunit|uniref:ATP phosphoribosyltransferase regulatory subunit n=1 Tax=Achromobacter mucicolens TaxID=1389922 RepID=A0ABM8LLS5_9BURK|nr:MULTISPECIES: ATP phosphoribosyltransferase regulatory subunit [Achromobacter]KXJ63109.1 ATP phosphoribosyltransferase regulatory subunit [Achromobacter xylosoxidans]OXC91157.1 ATP phosphoribosyltransferase regulatory subunit [Achromobacter sp. KAs 3-5]MCP2518349.1 ATP phosphoribosyltransferase regulatory subunit [Achromobacter mucicolens]MCU6617363.1 ATP phosphoribosyltransferase regulatory subunit [Achromobacter mucicolens]MDH1522194.1 ATP phosphoribosyltransferase regulatory subunit [Ach